MATISVGEAKAGRRAVVHDLPLVPFIDFMICLIAFLMVTAAWTQLSRINATGQVPGQSLATSERPPKELQVSATSDGFELRWMEGQTVTASRRVERVAVQTGDQPRYPALTRAITQTWLSDGQHRVRGDRALDRAVLHVQGDLPFSEIIAVLDSLHAPRGDKSAVFEVAFAPN